MHGFAALFLLLLPSFDGYIDFCSRAIYGSVFFMAVWYAFVYDCSYCVLVCVVYAADQNMSDLCMYLSTF